jgi:hypothetical protein
VIGRMEEEKRGRGEKEIGHVTKPLSKLAFILESCLT